MYEVVGAVDIGKEPRVNVRVVGTSKIFQKTTKELVTEKWIENFSTDDVAYISTLHASAYNDKLKIANKINKRVNAPTQSIIVLGILFVCFLLMSNITAMKVVALPLPDFLAHPSFTTLEFSAGLIFFPVTFILSDILTEVYGYKMSRMIIWSGCICNAIFLLGLMATVYSPPSLPWLETQSKVAESYETLFNLYTKVFFASTLAYFFGEFINSMVIAKLKVATAGRYLAARLVGSTFAGAIVDTLIFTCIVFYGVVSTKIILSIILIEITFKVFYEILMLPITYRITNYLKKKDGVDHYDFDTQFNPFRIQ